MQKAMNLHSLVSEVARHQNVKRDFVTSTRDNVRAVLANMQLFMVLLREGAHELERFSITEHAHRQIASRLSVPWKYYQRLLVDHPDMVMDTVNKLFEREPENRLFRVLDGKVRAFLSNQYLRLDNYDVLAQILSGRSDVENDTITVNGTMPEHRVMSSHVDENKMHMKVIFTGDDMAHEVARTRNGNPRIMRPGFRLSNSETGQGSLKLEGFFYDSYCTNGCVFGLDSIFKFQRNHLGGRLIEGEGFEVISDETRKKEDIAIIGAIKDGVKAISSPETVQQMAEFLRAKHNTQPVQSPTGAVDLAIKELDLRESEKAGILETFLRDGDYSQYGLASAITEQANNEQACSYARACELENVGAKLLQLGMSQWQQFVTAEPIAA